ncbi:hypothetical protein BDZ97DRAFT_1861935 [Flammula alnicola]|nr:hypothetical protein BDZ97DRAFT_1861935 [Flammula alnicola]
MRWFWLVECALQCLWCLCIFFFVLFFLSLAPRFHLFFSLLVHVILGHVWLCDWTLERLNISRDVDSFLSFSLLDLKRTFVALFYPYYCILVDICLVGTFLYNTRL